MKKPAFQGAFVAIILPRHAHTHHLTLLLEGFFDVLLERLALEGNKSDDPPATQNSRSQNGGFHKGVYPKMVRL